MCLHIYIYIDETKNLCQRLRKYNSGYGANGTSPAGFRSFCLFAYICGFNGNHLLMRHVEHLWKVQRDRLIDNGIACPKAIARSANGMLVNLSHSSQETETSKLCLICNFTD